MITRIQARNYKCLKYVDVSLSPFQVLVGPNGSGKSTFMDVLGFIRDMLWEREGLNAAVEKRARSFDELTWNGAGGEIEFAVDMAIPEEGQGPVDVRDCRYVIAVARDETAGGLSVVRESVQVGDVARPAAHTPTVHATEGRSDPGKGVGTELLSRTADRGTLAFDQDGSPRGDLRVPASRSFLADAVFHAAAMPDGAEELRSLLLIHAALVLHPGAVSVNAEAARRPCRPDAPKTLVGDGSNIAMVVRTLKERDPRSFKSWLGHLGTVLEDLQDVEVVEQEHDRHLYIKMLRKGGPPIPAWLMSDGALRFLGLTLLAYMPDNKTVHLVEEPEDGIHPQAAEAVFDSLRSVYGGQVVLATHSPLFVGLAEPEQLLCFSRTTEGGTAVVRGDQHRRMKHWRKETDLGTLYASGILDGHG